MVAALLALAAYGGDDDKKSDSRAPGATASPADRTGNDAFCEKARKYSDRFTSAFLGDLSALVKNPTDKNLQMQFGEHLRQAQDAGREIENEVPAKIAGDFKTSLEAGDRLLSELEKVEFDFTRLNTDTLSAYSTPEFQEASNRLNTYFTGVCKIPQPTLPPDLQTPAA